MSIANKDELQKYGIKYTTKGTPYMLTNFWFQDFDDNYKKIWQYDVEKIYDELEKKWKVFHDTMEKPSQDQQEYRVTTSIMYGNNGKWERNSFSDSAIGFVFEDGYKYKQMFMHNMHCDARPIKLDKNGKSIKSWEGSKYMEQYDKRKKTYVMKKVKDKTNEGHRDYYDKSLNDKDNETQFVEKSIEKDNQRKALLNKYIPGINKKYLETIKKRKEGDKNIDWRLLDSGITWEIKENCDFIEKDPYIKPYIKSSYTEKDGHVFTNLYQDDLYYRHGRLTFQNNECHVDVWPPKIASLIINLTDREKREFTLMGSDRLNTRGMRLKQIAYSMESIIKFQRDVLKKDKILFRDEEKQEIEMLTLEQFKNRIADLCIQHNNQCKDEEEKIDISKMNCNNYIKNQLANYGAQRGYVRHKEDGCYFDTK